MIAVILRGTGSVEIVPFSALNIPPRPAPPPPPSHSFLKVCAFEWLQSSSCWKVAVVNKGRLPQLHPKAPLNTCRGIFEGFSRASHPHKFHLCGMPFAGGLQSISGGGGRGDSRTGISHVIPTLL